jgi:hypothetical protein
MGANVGGGGVRVGRVAIGVVALAGAAMLMSTTTVGAAKPTFSGTPADYFPAAIGGRNMVQVSPSTGAGLAGSCGIPADGEVIFVSEGLSPHLEGGIWNCAAPAQANQSGTGFLAGLDAGITPAGIAKLNRQQIVATTPSAPGEAPVGPVLGLKVSTVSVKGQSVQVFTWHETDGVQSGGSKTFNVAATEPVAHLQVTVATPSGAKPLTYLLAMLKAGLGLSARATPAQ